MVDDASDVAVTADLGRAGLPLTILRQDAAKGAGAARNRGLEAVTSDHCLFFDADDDLLPEMATLCADLQGRSFDFCLFRHLDSRVRAEGRWGQAHYDDGYWQAAGVGMGALRSLPSGAALHLAQIANYPWNKVYRTQFLREARLRCTEIPVHNDVELHWASFIAAGEILVSDRIACEHIVHPAGTRLTNRRGADRFRVIEAFAAVMDRIDGDVGWTGAFATFCAGLQRWIVANLDEEFRAGFVENARRFWSGAVDDLEVARIAASDGDAADALRQLRG